MSGDPSVLLIATLASPAKLKKKVLPASSFRVRLSFGSDKYKGKFDMGWEKLRETIFANQKKLGVIPESTVYFRPGTDEEGAAHPVVVQEGAEAFGRLAIADQGEMPGGDQGGSGDPRLVLGTFSYAKLPMVADLAA